MLKAGMTADKISKLFRHDWRQFDHDADFYTQVESYIVYANAQRPLADGVARA